MSATFLQTTRALETERFSAGSPLALAALALLAGWGLWFARAQVTVRAATTEGRIEVSEMAHAVDAPVAGRVAASHLLLGAVVERGAVLVEIDADSERKRLVEEETRLSALPAEIDALARQLAALEDSRVSDRAATAAARAQARARHEASQAAALVAREEAARAEVLAARGAISDLEWHRARSLAEQQRATGEALALEDERLAAAQRARDDDSRGRGEELRATVASLEGQKSRSRAAIEVLRAEIDKRTIRAAVSGRVGDVARAHVGEYVKEGDRLGSVVPSGSLRAVADFAPEAALGRVRPGQTARLRLDGFPWAQYGTVDATVSSVANEPRNDRIRVELEVHPSPSSRIPLEHGLPGSVEVDIERSTPAELAWRAAGRILGRPARSGAQGRP